MSKVQCYLGVDVGNNGACALLDAKDGKVIDFFKMPTRVSFKGTSRLIIDARKLYKKLSKYNIVNALVERSTMRNQVLANNYGVCVATLDILAVPNYPVDPKTWINFLAKEYKIKDKSNANKDFTLNTFKTLYPNTKLPKKRSKLDDDIADAILIAHTLYLKYKGIY